MARGLMDPSEFGVTNPQGDHVGYHEQLDYYFDAELDSAEREALGSKAEYHFRISTKFTAEREPLAEHEMPNEFRVERTYKRFGDLMKTKNRLLAVQEPLKDLIESFEPDTHQFWPMRLSNRRGETLDVSVFGLVIRQFRDSVLPDQSDWDPNRGKPPKWYHSHHNFGRKKDIRLTLETAAREGAHLWRERRWRSPQIFLSDELQSAIKERGLRIFKHYQAEEV